MSLTNIGNSSTENLAPLLNQKKLLESVRNTLHHSNTNVIRASSICILKFTRKNTRVMIEAGFEQELKKAIGEASPFSIEEDREVHERIRIALGFIESKSNS